MSVQDFSFLEAKDDAQFKIAAISDRILAFAFDVFLFSPLLHLSLSPLLKKIQIFYISAPESLELMMLSFVAVITLVLEIIILQTVFVTKWGGTPGKLFLKLRVVSYGYRSPNVSPTQAFIRSLLWVVEATLLFVPFVEVLSHIKRRALHDRGAETMVITLKTEGDPGPHFVERHFINRSLGIFALILGAWMVFALGKAYELSASGTFKKRELMNSDSLCSVVPEDSENRVDVALGLYLADAASEDCVLSEADFALWTGHEKQKPWAQLAMAMVHKDDKKLSNAYLDQVCGHAPESEACALAKNFAESLKSKELVPQFKHAKSLTARVLNILKAESRSDYVDLQENLKQLGEPGLEYFKIKHQLKLFWSQSQVEMARGLFTAGVLSLPKDDRVDLAAWLCLEELQRDCHAGVQAEACRENQDLVNSYRQQKQSIVESQVLWSWLKTRECRGSSEPLPMAFTNILEKRSGLRRLVEATRHDGQMDQMMRERVLGELAQKETGNIKRWAMLEWIKSAKQESSLEKIYEILAETNRQDLYWFENSLAAFRQAFALKKYELAVDFSDLVGDGHMVKHKLLKEQILALSEAGDLQRAKVLTIENKLSGAKVNRLPASHEGL